ncbi:MAG: RHS repeat-associated core domain-containing protein, partial [Akkermansia sp.]|nr:RHS repeat-associated core domain-containing protein [Akkermansia sp.]
LQVLTKPNGMTLTQTYEATRDLLTGMAYHRGSTLVAQRTYTYDILGRPTARNTSRQGSVMNDTFAHNTRSELVEATVSGKDYEYAYDNIGNRQQATEGNEVTVYDANALNQYIAISENGAPAFQPQFDADGNQTLIKTETGIWSAVYNAENRPVSFTNADSSTVVECAYDSMGRRAYKKVTTNGSVTLHQRYIYRGYLQIACVDLTRSHHPCLWLLTWDPSELVATRPLAIQISGTWHTYGWDLTKNICELYGTTGYISTAYTYTPFGQVTASGSVTQPIQWSSEVWDSELGLAYYNWRYYNTLDGRWNGRDTWQELSSLNLLSFCKNNVVIYIDHAGNFEWVSNIRRNVREYLRRKLYETTLEIGKFDRTQQIPLNFLRKYIYEDSEPYILNRDDLIHKVKPRGSFTSSDKFARHIKERCNSESITEFNEVYTINFMDTGHKTGGLGRFNLTIKTNIICCKRTAENSYYWNAYGKAKFDSEFWDFDSSFGAFYEENKEKIKQTVLHGADFNLLAGRETRTYLFSFVPGRPFKIICHDELIASQSSYEKYIALE